MEIYYICKWCQKPCKNANSHRNHERLCPHNPNRNYISYTLGKPAWNKGLTRESDGRVAQYVKKCIDHYADGTNIAYNKGKKHSDEVKIHIREGIAKAKAEGKNVGGYRAHKSGYGKKCIADGIFFDSSWEVAYWFYNKENGNKLERNTKEFLYEYQNKTHRYLPDFFDGSNYIEIKGYEDEKCQAKYQSVNNLVVIKDVSKEINYMTEKYGDDWLNKVCEKIYN